MVGPVLWVLIAVLMGSVCVAEASVPDDETIRVAPDRWSFESARTHQRFIPFGSNLVLTSKDDLNVFGPRYDDKRYDRILAACEKLNINLLKVFLPIGNVLPDPQAPGEVHIAPGYIENLESFLKLCRKHHIRAVITLSEWGGNGCKWWHEGGQYFGRRPWKTDAGIDSLDVLCRFWAALARRLRGNPTVFSYTPCVEWSFPSSNLTWFPPNVQHGVLPSEPGAWCWRHWLLAKYGSLEAVNAAWGTAYPRLDDIPLVDYAYDPQARRYKDPVRKILDYQNFREWTSLRYFRPQIAAIRKADPGHMVTISNHMRQWDLWEGAAMYFMGFTAAEQKGLVDYVTHHANYQEQDLANKRTVADLVHETEAMLRFCHAGRPMPVMLEEFSFASADPTKTAETQAVLVTGTIGHASGWTTWYLQYPADPNEADARDKSARSAWLDTELKPTPWGKTAAGLYEELCKTNLSRVAPRCTVTLDRATELAPVKLGRMLELSRSHSTASHPLDYALPHERDLEIRLPGD